MDGKYDTEFPNSYISEQLEQISRSIKLVNSLAFYDKFIFDLDSVITQDKLKGKKIQDIATNTDSFNKSASGTATIIGTSIDQKELILLTCAHIIDFPDTIYSFFTDRQGNKLDIIESISLKIRQTNYSDFPGGGQLETVLIDNDKDVALVSGKIRDINIFSYPVFKYPLGESSELNWGNFVYTFGFPMHHKMISKALVSIPAQSGLNYFMIDAVVNRGFSGGLVLAIRDGAPNFELVGMISWVPAEKEYILKPKPLVNEQRYQVDAEYDGENYVGVVEGIKYGVTKVLRIETIKQTLKDQRSKLKKYSLVKYLE
ncbi:serine protease [Bacteroidota bacterium]